MQDPFKSMSRLIASMREQAFIWMDVRKNGCNDPNYADGTLLNMRRTYIISIKKDIVHLCDTFGMEIPESQFVRLPPLVPDMLFTGDRHSKRHEWLANSVFKPPLIYAKEGEYEYQPFTDGMPQDIALGQTSLF